MFPKKGTTVPPREDTSGKRYAAAISDALRGELGTSSRATKTVMRWTGASDRAVKYWIEGTRGPDGSHLILLARNSDAVLHSILKMADRDLYELSIELNAATAALTRAIAIIAALRASEGLR
ncbi:hypothetical protein HNQ96_001893 [Aminobacter lissarensis]|uniref:Uncharacterized protein n=1 Tax=Aminobacter carboxidus TaxID=376165 RepID=A0A8E1WC80_9HYPH|nr:hypothetical protein [Aminobacter lissarensis]